MQLARCLRPFAHAMVAAVVLVDTPGMADAFDPVSILDLAPMPSEFDPLGQAVSLILANAAAARYEPGQTFSLVNVTDDEDGTRHVRLNRQQDGLPVLGGDLVAHIGPGNKLRKISQTLASSPRIATIPKVTRGSAAQTALAQTVVENPRVTSTQLVVSAGDTDTSLAYEVVVSGRQSGGVPSQLHLLVDAERGNVLDTWDAVKHADTGVGHGFHNGIVALGTSLSGGGYSLTDGGRGGHRTYDLDHSEGWETGALYTSPVNVFGDGSVDTPATAGADAHYAAAATWDYYLDVHGRRGIRNDGVAAYSRTHFGERVSKAFWNDECFCMTYGDGDTSEGWYPLTSLDVGGHEFTHGVTSNTAGLRYSGESGALDEATSDIFGTMVEFHTSNANDPADYQIGEQARTDGTALRYMYRPTLDGLSAMCWSETVRNLDVHYSSGVGNHFFFLLAEGSGSTPYGDSPTCNGSIIPGIGRAKAAQIWYRALTRYMTSRTNYRRAREATLDAASDLYGDDSFERQTVANAWTAVGVKSGLDPVTVALPPRLASADSAGRQLNASSYLSGISADGRYILLGSRATNTGLVINPDRDPSRGDDVYAKDMTTGVLTPVSVNAAGTMSGNDESVPGAISGDGRWVVFTSLATDLVAGDTNQRRDVFVRDMRLGETRAISDLTSTDQYDLAQMGGSAISSDGRYAVMLRNGSDIVVVDLINDAATVYPQINPVDKLSLSADGTRLLFRGSQCPGCWDSIGPIELLNTQTGARTIAVGNSPLLGVLLANQADASMSDDGRYITFLGYRQDDLWAPDVLVHDTLRQVTEFASFGTGGTWQPGFPDASPRLSGNGRILAWHGPNELGRSYPGGDTILYRDLYTSLTLDLTPQLRPTAEPTNGAYPLISQNGRRVAYEIGGDDPTQVYVVSVITAFSA